jgi:medium-chain acyl-[acyl-carrier-protein] hydrolase
MKENIFSEQHRVTYYEADFTKRMTLSMLLDVIILASEDHSDKLGVNADFVHQFGVTWVVIQYNVDIKRLPMVDETITITTKSKSYNKYFAYREFIIKDQEETEIVKMTGLWAVMNFAARRIAMIPKEIVEPFGAEAVNRVPKLNKPQKIDVSDSTEQVSFRVRYTDIDSNQHVNNSHYMDWMINVLPADFLTNHTPIHFNLRYENEVKYGETVNSYYQMVESSKNQIVTNHVITSGKKHSATANIVWQRNN